MGPLSAPYSNSGERREAQKTSETSGPIDPAIPDIDGLDDFDFTFQRSVKRAQIAHLAQLDFLAEAHNVVFLGPPGTGKSHLSIALGVQAARRGYRVAFATAHEWVLRLAAAKRTGRLESELERLGRIQLVIVDEVGYIPFDPEAGALFFALISSRYERRSLVVNSNKTFSAWAEIFGDPVAVAAMVDRLVHHAEVIVLRGDSFRLKGKGKEVLQPEGLREVSRFRPALPVQVSTGVDNGHLCPYIGTRGGPNRVGDEGAVHVEFPGVHVRGLAPCALRST